MKFFFYGDARRQVWMEVTLTTGENFRGIENARTRRREIKEQILKAYDNMVWNNCLLTQEWERERENFPLSNFDSSLKKNFGFEVMEKSWNRKKKAESGEEREKGRGGEKGRHGESHPVRSRITQQSRTCHIRLRIDVNLEPNRNEIWYAVEKDERMVSEKEN